MSGNTGIPRRAASGTRVAKKIAMLIPATLIESSQTKNVPSDFWLRIFRDEELRDCDNLQKLLVGCEIIAALDGVDLLAA